MLVISYTEAPPVQVCFDPDVLTSICDLITLRSADPGLIVYDVIELPVNQMIKY